MSVNSVVIECRLIDPPFLFVILVANGCLLFVIHVLVLIIVCVPPPFRLHAVMAGSRRVQDDRPGRALDVLKRRSPDEIRRNRIDLVLDEHPAGISRIGDQSVDSSRTDSP